MQTNNTISLSSSEADYLRNLPGELFIQVTDEVAQSISNILNSIKNNLRNEWVFIHDGQNTKIKTWRAGKSLITITCIATPGAGIGVIPFAVIPSLQTPLSKSFGEQSLKQLKRISGFLPN